MDADNAGNAPPPPLQQSEQDDDSPPVPLPLISESACERAVLQWELLENTFPIPIIPKLRPNISVFDEVGPYKDPGKSYIEIVPKITSGIFIRGQTIGRPTEWQAMLHTLTKEEEVKFYLALTCKGPMNKRPAAIYAKVSYDMVDEEKCVVISSTDESGEPELRRFNDGSTCEFCLGTKQYLQSKREELVKDGILRINLHVNMYKQLPEVSNVSSDNTPPAPKRRRLDSANPQAELRNLIGSLETLWKNRSVSGDITIKCDGQLIKAHNFILASRSEVFKNMLQIGTVEQKTQQIEISDFSVETITSLLEFIYLGYLTKFDWANIDHIGALMRAADKYLIIPLKNLCNQSLSRIMNLNNFGQIAKIAFFYDCEKMLRDEVRHFYESHQVTLNGVESFRKFAHEDFDEFIQLFFYCIGIN